MLTGPHLSAAMRDPATRERAIRLIVAALDYHDGVQADAADALDIGRRTLVTWLSAPDVRAAAEEAGVIRQRGRNRLAYDR